MKISGLICDRIFKYSVKLQPFKFIAGELLLLIISSVYDDFFKWEKNHPGVDPYTHPNAEKFWVNMERCYWAITEINPVLLRRLPYGILSGIELRRLKNIFEYYSPR